MTLIGLALGWLLFCTIHSVLISDRAVHFLSTSLRDKSAYYRLMYNILSAILLAPVVWYESHLNAGMTDWFPELRLIRILFLVVAAVFFVAGGRQYNPLSFLGIEQIRSGRSARTLSKENDLVTSGVLAWVRHPWYTGVFCLLAARPLTPVSLTSSMVLFFYLIVGARLEERRLVKEFGEVYRRYQARVPLFIPWTLGSRLFR